MPAADLSAVLFELKGLGSEEGRAGMARFGVSTDKAYGVSMAAMAPLQRRIKRDQALALALWASGVHEARILAALVADPKAMTPALMDAWTADFDSWDVCDQVAMKVFARTPHVVTKVVEWAGDDREFVRRAAFATMAGFISPITFVISLFTDRISIYEVHNTGAWYDFGFVLGAGILFGGGFFGMRRSRD